jgi:tetratricopeptide (TPR) repeat protein
MSLQAAYDQARQWLESNDLNRAIGLAQYILEHYPDNLDAYRILGEAYLAHRQLDRAQEAFERVLRSDPENIPAHVGLGFTYERQGRLERAIPELEQALEIKPDMPELRSQLLRLYTDAWGSEHAHLRLSRAGLARLYAKGHMLPQAIGEFRQVVADQPERLDAMIAMAEALWRDGQEDEAVALCRRILAQRPEALKANLILGYLEMATGKPEGEHAWEAARRMDPYQVVARAVFDTLPPENADEPLIDEWDEQTWRQRRTEEEQERIAATRPMEAVTPVGIPSDRAGNGSRRSMPPAPPRSAVAMGDSDDFLASLLAINTAPPPPPPAITPQEEEDLDLDLGMTPFSLDDLDGGDTRPPVAPSAMASAGAETDEPSMLPFSLSDLGLSDDEVASLESLNQAPVKDAQATPADVEDDEPSMLPFSLSDLGLSDDEVAGLESLNQGSAKNTPTPPAEDDGPPLTPFSLNDLGLTDEEIASLEGSSVPSRPPLPDAPPAEAPEPSLTPFSLSDLGLTDEDLAGLGDLGTTKEQPSTGRAGLPEPPRSPVIERSEPVFDANDLPADLQPFSLDELDLDVRNSNLNDTLGSSLTPFSYDEPPPPRPRVSGFMADEGFESSSEEPEHIPESGGFSWQQPSQKSQPGFLKSVRGDSESDDDSIFSKLRQRHEREDKIPPPELPAPSIERDEHLGLFSMDDIPLRLDHELGPDLLASVEATPPAAPEVVPPVSSAPAAPPQPPAPPAAPIEVDSLQEAIDAGQVQPFSLADLGLSAEEIAALGLGDAVPEPPEVLEEPKVAAPAPPELDSSHSPGYLLDDLEPALPEVITPEPPAEARTSDSDESSLSGELQPFSLADLGLSEEEIVALGLDISTEHEEPATSELGLTEEELEGLNLGDLSWNQPIAAPTPTPTPPAAAPALAPQTTSGDLLVDRLIALGREQGYVDISDIIATFENPEAEAERIEEIGRRLHEAQIEIRDGDEVIDMDADYSEEEEPASYSEPALVESAPAVPEQEEPPLTPFSLSDLGLTAEEIAALGLGDAPAAKPAVPEPEEPLMTPFSLRDLGLSDEEIASLEPGETALKASESALADLVPEAPEPAPAEEEPVMTPFSLSDLGLSEEEIAALGMGEASTGVGAAATPPAEEEPVMTPFSLHDLGLSDEEIAALEAGETLPDEPEPAAPAPVEEEPVMTPFSLSDLGLNEEEIAALGMGEALAEIPEPVAEPEPARAEAPAPKPLRAPEPPPVKPERRAPEPPPITPEPARPVAAPVPAKQPPAAPAAAVPSRRSARAEAEAPPTEASGNTMLDTYVRRLEDDPQNNGLRLSVARAGGQLGMSDFALLQYRYLIKQNILLDQIEDDLQDLILDAEDRQVLRRLHRALGDVYTKQGRLAEAIDEYSWTPAGS